MSRHLRAVTGPLVDDLEAQALALDEECPRCGAAPGEACVGTVSGGQMRATHWQRVREGTRREAGQ